MDQFLKSLLNLLQCCFCFVFWFFGHKVCEFLAPWPEIEPVPPAVEGKVLNAWCWWFRCKVVSNSCDPVDCSPPGPSVRGVFSGKNTGVVAIPFSRGSSRPWDQTRVSCIAGGFFTDWATREDPSRKPLRGMWRKNGGQFGLMDDVVAGDLGFVESCSPGLCPASPTRPQQAGRNAWKTRPLIFQEFSKAKFCFIILSMCTFVTTYPLEIRVESPNHTEPTDFWRIQAGRKNDTIVFIGTSFEKILSFLPMDRICIKTRFPNRATCGICL